MYNKIFVLLFLACVHSIYSVSVSFIHKCNAADAKCMKESAQIAIPIFAEGIPELGIETLDPLKIDKIDGSSPSLKLLLKDLVGTGLKQCIAKKVKLDDSRKKILVKLLCTVEFHANYEIDGSLLVLRINGNGKAYILLNKIQITVEADLDEVKHDDGLTYWHIKDWRHSYELKDKAKIELENLFNGNEALGRATRELINSSPNEVIAEVAPEMIREVIERIVKNVGIFLIQMDLSQLLQS